MVIYIEARLVSVNSFPCTLVKNWLLLVKCSFSILSRFWDSLTQTQLYEKCYQNFRNDSVPCTCNSCVSEAKKRKSAGKNAFLQKKSAFPIVSQFFNSLTQTRLYRKHYQNFSNDSLFCRSWACVSESSFPMDSWKTHFTWKRRFFSKLLLFGLHWHRLNCTENTIKFFQMIVFSVWMVSQWEKREKEKKNFFSWFF